MKPGPKPKEPGRRQRHGGQALEAPRGSALLEAGRRPKPPAGLSAQVAVGWRELWNSELAPFIRVTDLPALTRLFQLREEAARTRAELRPKTSPRPRRRKGEEHNDWMARQADWRRNQVASARLIKDGKGGYKLNPLLGYLDRLEAQVVALEDRFALNLQSRAKIGLAQLRAETLAEQNSKQEAQQQASDEPEEDPRDALVLSIDRDPHSRRRQPAQERSQT